MKTRDKVLSLALLAAASCGPPPPAAPPPGPKAAETTPPPKPEPAPMTPKELAQKVLERLVAHDFAAVEATFGPHIRQAVDAKKLASAWGQIEGAGGAYESLGEVTVETTPEVTVVHMPARFAKAQFDVTVTVMNEGQKVEGLLVRPKNVHPYAPPPYADPATFAEKDVTVGSGALALAGTLTTPKGAKGKVPGVVLVHGSGPNDRDETVGGVKLFRDLAWGLAARGIAVLRYEKRTHAHAKEIAAQLADLTPKEETVDDAVLAVRVLAADPDVDPKRAFVLGHSMGATFAPRIAAGAPEVRGLVLVAGSTRPLEDVILDQYKYVLGLGGVPAEEAKTILADIERQVQNAKDPKLSLETPPASLPLGIAPKYWLDIRGYDPAAAAAAAKRPVLVLQGERDYQVTRADYARYEKAFAGRKDATLKLLPGISHVLTTAPPGAGAMSTPDEYEVDANVAVSVIDEVARFINATKAVK